MEDNGGRIHRAMARTGDATQYFAMAWMAQARGTEPGWVLESAIERLTEAADALGYDLVKRVPAQVEEAA
jgi:hypothetical protein